MSTGSTFSVLTAALKRRYDDQAIGECTWSKSPLAAAIKKKKWSGANPAFPIRVGNSPARSQDFAKAQAKAQNSTYGYTKVFQMVLDWYRDYGVATIDGLLLNAASDKLGTFYDQFVLQVDGVMDATMHSFSTKIYRAGFGAIATINASANLATTTLLLTNIEDAVLFERGMDLIFASTESASVLRTTTVLTVTGVNTITGALTLSATPNSLAAGIAVGDFIFVDGDRQNSATPSRLCQAGLAAWLPTTVPGGGENFFGNDRSVDTRLIGAIIDANASGFSEEEALINAVVEAARFGGKPRMGFVNPTGYKNLQLQGMGRYRPAKLENESGLGFEGITINTNYGNVDVFPDRYCPQDRGYVLDIDSWCTYIVGTASLPTFLTADGNKILRQAADDGVEARIGYYAATGCNAPIHNAVIKF